MIDIINWIREPETYVMWLFLVFPVPNSEDGIQVVALMAHGRLSV